MKKVEILEKKIEMVNKLKTMLLVNPEVEKFGVEKFDFEDFSGYIYPEKTFNSKDCVYRTRDELLSFISHNLLVLPAELQLINHESGDVFNSIDLSSFVGKK